MDYQDNILKTIKKYERVLEKRVVSTYTLYEYEYYYWILRECDKELILSSDVIESLTSDIVVVMSYIGNRDEVCFDLKVNGKTSSRHQQYIYTSNRNAVFYSVSALKIRRYVQLILSGQVTNIPPSVIGNDVKEFYGLA